MRLSRLFLMNYKLQIELYLIACRIGLINCKISCLPKCLRVQLTRRAEDRAMTAWCVSWLFLRSITCSPLLLASPAHSPAKQSWSSPTQFHSRERRVMLTFRRRSRPSKTTVFPLMLFPLRYTDLTDVFLARPFKCMVRYLNSYSQFDLYDDLQALWCQC